MFVLSQRPRWSRLLRTLLVVCILGGVLPATTPTAHAAAQYFLLTVTSDPGKPITVRVDCRVDADPVQGHTPRFGLQLLSARVNPDGTLIDYPKWITVFTSRTDAPYNQSTYCYDDPTLVNGKVADTTFDMAFDLSWFPTDGQYVIGAILYDVATGGWLASMPTGQITRPPLVSLATTITSDVANNPATVNVQVTCDVWPERVRGHTPPFYIMLVSEFYGANGAIQANGGKIQEVFRSRLDAPYNQSTHCYDNPALVNGRVADQTLDLTLDGSWFPESGTYAVTAYIVDSENYTWYTGTRATPAFVKKAASTLSVAVASDTTAAQPLGVAVSCTTAPGPTGRPTLPTLWLRSLALVGGQWVQQKQQQVWTASGTWQHCYDQLDQPGGDVTFDYALDATWFPVNHTQYRIEAWTTQITSGVELARAQTPASFIRPIDKPGQALIGGPSLVGSTWGGTTRGPLAMSWSSVTGAQSYDVTLLRPNGTTRAFGSVASTQLTAIAPGGPDGVYRVRVATNGPAGQSLTTEGSVVVDTVAPGLPSGIVVTPTITNQRDGFAVGWLPASDALRYSMEVRGSFGTRALNGGAPISGTQVSSLSVLQPTDADGAYDLYVTAIDDAGNVGTTSAHATLTLDTVPPLPPTSVTVPPVTDQNTVQATWPAVLDAARYQVVRRAPDGTTTTITTTSNTQATIPLDREGTFEIRVTSVDAAGNSSTSDRRATVTRDTGPPPAPGQPTAPSLTNQSAIVVSWPATADTAQYRVGLIRPDGTVVTTTITAPTTSLFDLALDGGDGTYRVRVVAEDAVGNPGAASPSVSIVRDTVAPQPLSTAPQGETLTANDTAAISWPSIADAATTVITVTGPSGLAQVVTVAAPATRTDLTLDQGDGSYRITVAGRDAAGNVAAPSPALVVTRDTTPPAAPASAPTVPDRTSAASLPLAWPAVADAHHYEVVVNGAVIQSPTTPTATLTGTDGETLTVQILAVDAAGNRGPATPAVTVRFDRTAPQVTLRVDAVPDGTGLVLTWTSEAGSTAQVVRTYPDGHEESLPSGTSPLVLPASYGEAVTGRLVVTDTAGNAVTVPFGPATPSQIGLSGSVVDSTGGTIAPGDILYATITVSNTGLSDQAGTIVEVPVPAGLTLLSAEPQPTGSDPLRWNLGLLPAGTVRTVSVAFRVAGDGAGKDVTLQPRLRSSSAPVQTLLLDAPGSDGVVAAATGTLSATVALRDTTGGSLDVGDSVAVQLTLTATGQRYTNGRADLTLPGWLSLQGFTPQPEPNAPAGVLRWVLAALEDGQATTIVITGTVSARGVGQTLSVAPVVVSDQTGTRTLSAVQLGPVRDLTEVTPTPSTTAQPTATSTTVQPTPTSGMPATPVPPTPTAGPDGPTAQPTASTGLPGRRIYMALLQR